MAEMRHSTPVPWWGSVAVPRGCFHLGPQDMANKNELLQNLTVSQGALGTALGACRVAASFLALPPAGTWKVHLLRKSSSAAVPRPVKAAPCLPFKGPDPSQCLCPRDFSGPSPLKWIHLYHRLVSVNAC